MKGTGTPPEEPDPPATSSGRLDQGGGESVVILGNGHDASPALVSPATRSAMRNKIVPLPPVSASFTPVKPLPSPPVIAPKPYMASLS